MADRRIDCDALVIGAGPAGSSTASILAQAGHSVVILEKEQFPRYRVGESLIPHCWFPLERMGALDRVRDAGFVEKHSVQFVTTDAKHVTPFYFTDHTDHDCARSWQVRRAHFDQVLLDTALQHGATVHMETAAKSLVVEDNVVVGVSARQGDDTVQVRAPITIDASGRDLFATSRSEWRVADPELRKIAIWTYYRGAMRDEGRDAGATTIAYLPDKGWFWYIPLADDLVSVGIVAERDYLYRAERDPQTIFDREVETQPWIREHLAPGTRVDDFRVTGDYSYRSRFCARDGLVLCGDAFAFLDPVFSSGLFLALQSGVMAGDAAVEALRTGDVSAARFEDYADHLCSGIEAMRQLVFAFYDTGFSFAALMRKHPDLRGDLTDCLIGRLDRDFSALFDAVGEFARLPDPIEYGRPQVS